MIVWAVRITDTDGSNPRWWGDGGYMGPPEGRPPARMTEAEARAIARERAYPGATFTAVVLPHAGVLP